MKANSRIREDAAKSGDESDDDYLHVLRERKVESSACAMADDESMDLTGFFFGKVDERGWLEYDDNGQAHPHGLCLIPCVRVVDWYTCGNSMC